MTNMFDNETINKIREIRMEISARFGHDPKRLVEYYKEKQKIKIKSNIRPTSIIQSLAR